jgi:multidrug efflux pump subunit AcrB
MFLVAVVHVLVNLVSKYHEIVLTGPEMAQLQELSEEVQALLEEESGVVDVRDNLGSVTDEIALRPNREALDFFGLTQADLAAQIRFALSNDQVGEFVTPGAEDDLEIRVGTDWPIRSGFEAGGPSRYEELALVRAFTPSGESVALLSLLEPVQSSGSGDQSQGWGTCFDGPRKRPRATGNRNHRRSDSQT